ncbi:putative peptidoglycan D,D-transpeptidase PenA [Candidatus Rhabdochlamydia oedothoracis]|uniref:Peptidoglycan D,D-transpeptidase PenA n=1 Tax=Candidatus Rhabdochlamydia oedothoracis TaxID=2720720 RepID=A0ABX8V837_9BACT|nr:MULTISPECIES: penicillin-binding protein 2 [Rhabdochlamydia]KAG6559346.1 putative peptidoglycan D,D-transpeptidase PenA [Candidatus Rhabdochlamydia sp. W815]MCL6755912.1 penicillin-binding protein 2 [Candidatus Rhabdochlamydia oedothoracis]QYF49195.1 putative peptidoglycan D,D-transpeptidase PenA [Candidatus Rhabdochlamydia oedothoracis]
MLDNNPSPWLVAYKRLVWVFGGLFLLFSILILRFFHLQIIEGKKWEKMARTQHQLLITEPCKRGVFYSNTALKKGHPENPQTFVIDILKFHLYADPKSIPSSHRKEITDKIADICLLNKAEAEKLQAYLNLNTRSRKLAMWLSQKQKNILQEWWFAFAKTHKIAQNALFFIQDYQRSYPFGKLLGQVLHTVRQEKDQKSQKSIPTGGMELFFNTILQGKEGKRYILRSPRHSLETAEVIAEPENGADIHLTINHHLQALAEEEIYKAVKLANAKSGWAVLMEPHTGEIWTLAQYPWFDPRDCQKYFNDENLIEHTKVKAITDPFEPGSTMKPLTVALALKANLELQRQGKPALFAPEEKIKIIGKTFPGRKKKPIRDVRSHSYLNMYMALQKSSNIYMAILVERIITELGEKWYRDALQDIFGFGLKTGIELPSESTGFLPVPGKKSKNGKTYWSVPTPYSMAFGHNITANSLQMLRAYAILANGGKDVKPTLVRKITRKKKEGLEEVLFDNTTQERVKGFPRLLEQEIIEHVLKALKYVTKPGGSAAKADIYGYTEVGKSSTSEKIVSGVYSKKNHISSFIGFAPVSSPRFVLLVVIDEPEYKYIPGVGRNQHGGRCAAPAFREIGLRTLEYLGIPPDDPHGYSPQDPRYDKEKGDWLKESRTLLELYKKWNG